MCNTSESYEFEWRKLHGFLEDDENKHFDY